MVYYFCEKCCDNTSTKCIHSNKKRISSKLGPIRKSKASKIKIEMVPGSMIHNSFNDAFIVDNGSSVPPLKNGFKREKIGGNTESNGRIRSQTELEKNYSF